MESDVGRRTELIDFVVTPGPTEHINTRRHYIDHMVPVWFALPESVRGQFAVCSIQLGNRLLDYGIEPTVYRNGPALLNALQREKRLTLVAGHGETAGLDTTGRPNAILMHGVGFNFDPEKTLSCYPGTKHNRRNTVLMLLTNERIAQVERDANPHVRVMTVGCPKLDKWHRQPPKPRADPPTIAFAFHWRCRVAPEAGTAWSHYQDTLPEVAKQFHVLGHGHPHIIDRLTPQYQSMGIEVVRDLDEVFERADLLCFDATSAGYEFASLDRPVVVLNAPWYRRGVNFGLRFWDHADVGVQVDEPGDLIAGIRAALEDSPNLQENRHAATTYAYEFTDGHCAERAAKAIMEVL